MCYNRNKVLNTIQHNQILSGELEGRERMDKSQLMEYLSAVCDAENALYACNEAIEQLQTKLQTIVIPFGCPVKPEKQAPHARYVEKKEVKGGCVIMVVGAVVSFFIVGTATQNGMAAIRFGIPIGAILPYGILRLATKLKYEEERNQAYESAVSSADTAYKRAMREYKEQMAVYERSQKVAEATRKELEDAIQFNKQTADRIEQELRQLYLKNVLHVSFRNMVAVNQIREYLDMGVCDALEGPTGAYSQYLQDVRVDRICTSIDKLKRSLLHALNQIVMNQSILVSEMRKTNENLNKMQSSIELSINDIQQQMNCAQQMATEQADQLENHFVKMNEQLEEIHKALSTSAHNEYVALRETNVRRYLKMC